MMLSGRRSPRLPHNFITPEGNAMITDTPFVRGFIEAMLFTERTAIPMEDWFDTIGHSKVEGLAEGCLPSDTEARHIAEDSIDHIRKVCAEWQDEHALLLALAYQRGYSEEQAGRDLWLTANGHGAGFWDRSELEADGLGEALSKKAMQFGKMECIAEATLLDGNQACSMVVHVEHWL